MLENGVRLAGRYEIVQLLGGGGMARVYLAQDLLLDRWVAVKVMSESLQHEQEFIQRFIREAKAAGSLSHPNVVSIYDIGREKTVYYMVMEYVEGTTLADYFFEQENLSLEDVIEVGIQICAGLAHAHSKGIIHRDIKLQNIMRTPEGTYKITDFGISSVSNASKSLTQTGTVMGSAHYFSPEQASGGHVSYSSDLYSLGVVLFKLLTHQYPFDADHSVSIALKHLQEEVPDPRQWNEEIPEAMVEVLYKALAKKPKDRYQSAEEMKEALLEVKESLLEPDFAEAYHYVKTGVPMNQFNEQAKQKQRSRWTIIAFVGLAIVVCMVGMAFWYSQGMADSEKQMSAAQQTLERKTVERIEVDSSSPPKKEVKGDHPWWKEFPKKKYLTNKYFQDMQVTGKDGQYQVSVVVGPMPERSFFYNIYVVDTFSSRLVLKSRQVFVPAKKDPSGKTVVQFPVRLPSSLLPGEGLLKIEMFRLDRSGDKKTPVDQLLQQWGSPPPDAKIPPNVQPGRPT